MQRQFFIIRNKYFRIYEDNFGMKVLRDDCTLMYWLANMCDFRKFYTFFEILACSTLGMKCFKNDGENNGANICLVFSVQTIDSSKNYFTQSL